MWPVIFALCGLALVSLFVLTAVVFEIRRLHKGVHALKQDVRILNEENGLTTVSRHSVHGIPEMNRWPVKPEPTWSERMAERMGRWFK